EVRLANRRASSAVAIQREYLAAARELCARREAEQADLIRDWAEVLDDLEAEPLRCRDRLDLGAQLALFREFQSAEGFTDDDPWLRSLDLEYHRLDPAAG